MIEEKNKNPEEISKAFEPALHEDAIYKKWEESGFFNPDNLPDADARPPYTIVLPPPNVTGTLHLGHSLMLAVEDILTRFHRMAGYRALWVPGTDHAAIATQTKVEKLIREEGLTRHQLGREKFLERVNKFAQESHDTIIRQSKKMGSSMDWSREAYTLDAVRTRAVRSVFKMMFEDGLIYRGERVVNWCPRCHSTLADDEVEYKEQKAKLYTFKYDKDFPISISTTRPETKLGDTAIAVNPKDERYKHLVGQSFAANFCGTKLNIKIIADRQVESDFGTGALGVTPAHSMVDWKMAKEQDLPIIKVINEDGNIHEGFGEFSGKSALEARELVAQRLREAGLMESEEDVANNLSVCYRCDTPIEPIPSLQWFVNVNLPIERLGNRSIKDLSLEAVRSGVFGRDKIRILPERFEKNYFHWMNNLGDWCISRQIWFGHRIPVWYRAADNQQQTESTEKYVGIEPPAGDGWLQDEDTLDTWFSSGLWTFSTLANSEDDFAIENHKLVVKSAEFAKHHPTSVLETGYDILFFWVARMIIMTTYAVNDIPFQDVYLHGLVRDEKGRKMSKSLGNVIDPLDMITAYGTDATRLAMVVGTTPGNDLNLGEEKISGFRNLVNKIWNIARFIATSYGIDRNVTAVSAQTSADRWILDKFSNLIAEVTADIKEYRLSSAAEKLRVFTWDDLADWYLEASKFEKSENKKAILSYIITNLLKLWHPFIPFVTEAIWQEIVGGEMLMIESWPKEPGSQGDDGFELVKKVILAIRNVRAENKVEPAKKIKAVIFANAKTAQLEAARPLIMGLRTNIGEMELAEKGEAPAQAIFAAVEGVEIYLLGAIDQEKEKARIAKEIEQLDKLIGAIEMKLSNQEFVGKAPAAVIAKEKEKLSKYQADKEVLALKLAY
ncbi:valine--tRNA ligase [Candidatus Falkowbacteria bacterium]|nr:valine--tRNA ligase [Candidatus Falkowbacteria bacterium]